MKYITRRRILDWSYGAVVALFVSLIRTGFNVVEDSTSVLPTTSAVDSTFASDKAYHGYYTSDVTETAACTEKTCGEQCAPRSPSNCTWKFLRYVPSKLEQDWWEQVDSIGRVPCTAVLTTFKPAFDIYMEEIYKMRLAPNRISRGQCICHRGRTPMRFDPTVFSRFEYENTCTHEVEESFIEPLAGVLRHPSVCYAEQNSSLKRSKEMYRKDWLLLDQWALHKNRDVRTSYMYFDAGASLWKSGFGGASQSWFDALFDSLCVQLDGFWMWELISWEPSRVFKALPARIRPRYHWYNIPADTNSLAGDSPVFHIKTVRGNAHRKSENVYVIFKLDIDNTEVEEAIVQGMLKELKDKGSQFYVDEFFWEHHINMEPMATKNWKIAQTSTRTQRESIEIFRTLREYGIRAHSWV
mmetsp:Transcript_49667/g.118288  ORF Transcript_49667/g.118288 Transcript_49667/m.118288 type:complete len:412 (+) Transcript_49667:60-1295(+)